MIHLQEVLYIHRSWRSVALGLAGEAARPLPSKLVTRTSPHDLADNEAGETQPIRKARVRTSGSAGYAVDQITALGTRERNCAASGFLWR